MLPVVAENKARRLQFWREVTLITWAGAGSAACVAFLIRFSAGIRECLPVAIFEAVVAIAAAVAWIRVRRALAALEKFL